MSNLYGVNGIKNGSPVYGLGGEPNGSMVYDDNTIATRKIPTLAGSQYGTIDTSIALTGDFNIEVIAATTVAANSAITAVFGKADATTNYAQLQNGGGNIGFVTVDGSVVLAKTDHLDGKIHTYNFKRVGNTISIDFDGNEIVSSTLGAASTVIIGLIGALSVGSPTQIFVGQILSVKFTDAGTVVANYIFDSGSDLYQLPRGEGLGSELVTNGTFDTDLTGFTDNSAAGGAIAWNAGGYLDLINTTGTARADFTITTVIGKAYTFNFSHILGAGKYHVGSSGVGSNNIVNSGTTGTTFTALSTTTYLRFFNDAAGTTASVDNTSSQQLPDLTCLLTNFATTDWNRYTLQRNILHDAGTITEAWMGDEQLSSSDVNFGAGNTYTFDRGGATDWAISGNLATLTEPDAADTMRSEDLGIVDGNFLTKYTIDSMTGGSINTKIGGITATSQTSAGEYTEILNNVANSSVAFRQLQFTGVTALSAVAVLSRASIKHLLEVA